MLITGTAGAAAATAPGAASQTASASKPSPTGSGDHGKPGDKQAWLAKLAASLHVSVQKLEAALIDVKQTMSRLGVGPFDPAVVSVVSHDLGISTDKAVIVLKAVFGDAGSGKGDPGKGGGKGKGDPGKPGALDPLMIHTLAGILHISDARAAQVLDRLDRIERAGHGISPTDPKFRAIAASLHITPQRLADALRQLKEALAGSMPKPSSSPVPGKS